ncbi:MAG: GIY-YIG nuclease family protein [Pegethrix bostrychoides GSE-TBD4-15B]|uniref:GIY-YIG nuclease family protein n=1 Tax=Pegethrix bostrychoides GSE-TBD4-15B TaxID=2839662 RepID=A0A951U451_9CYAN|nr:GIY-YIG nuclease family protein [Pegethrix bostrychoides GSE-TBD4-15B]
MLYLIGYREAGIYHIKIGIAANPLRRLKQLQTGNGHRLSVLKAIDCVAPRRVELGLHRQFSHYRKSGEWFELTAPVLAHLEQVMDRLAVDQLQNEQQPKSFYLVR